MVIVLDVNLVGFRSPGGLGLGPVGRGLAWNSVPLKPMYGSCRSSQHLGGGVKRIRILIPSLAV